MAANALRLSSNARPTQATADEIRRLLAMAASSKVRAMLSLAYGCGLRAGEVVRLGAHRPHGAAEDEGRAVGGDEDGVTAADG